MSKGCVKLWVPLKSEKKDAFMKYEWVQSTVVSLVYWVLWDNSLKCLVKLVLPQACAENCLKTPTCLAFEHSFIDNISLCMWYSTQAPPQNITPRNNYQYFSKNAVKVNRDCLYIYWTQLTGHLSWWKSSMFIVLQMYFVSHFSSMLVFKMKSFGSLISLFWTCQGW